MNILKMFKIRRTRDGLFSKGGLNANRIDWAWSKRGKTWSTIGAVKNHLNQYNNIPIDWEILEYSIDEDGMTTKVEKYNCAEFALKAHIERDEKDAKEGRVSPYYKNARETRRKNLEKALAELNRLDDNAENAFVDFVMDTLGGK